MHQVVGKIKVKLDQFGSKVHSTLTMVQNAENRLTSVILDKNNAVHYQISSGCQLNQHEPV